MRIELGDDEHPEIGLIALIDCIFFLLMFFMVATSFKQPIGEKSKELPVILPSAQMSLDPTRAGATPLTIGVDKQGKLYLDGSRVSVQGLHERLKQEAASYPDRPIRVAGDELARYQDIVHVLDLCQFEGFTRISMQTLR
jgi:biopolymer transport protein ExbD